MKQRMLVRRVFPHGLEEFNREAGGIDRYRVLGRSRGPGFLVAMQTVFSIGGHRLLLGRPGLQPYTRPLETHTPAPPTARAGYRL